MQMQNDLKSQLYGNYGLWYTPWWQTQWFYKTLIVIGVLSALAILVAIMLWVRARRKNIKPWAQARIELARLRQMEPAESKKFYTELTIILKKYMSALYGVSLVGKTDQEVVQLLRTRDDIAQSVKDYFDEIVQGGMYSKFANEQAVKSHMDHNLKQAFFIIEQTIPAEK